MQAIKVLIITGSESDLSRMQPSQEMLEKLGITSEMVVASAHRNPEKVKALVGEAEESGAEVIIAGAGMSAALPGVVAALTDLPVIGVPTKSAALDGMDSLLSIVQMPSGVPVATVAIDGAKNAGILAVQILSVKYPDLREAVRKHKESLKG